MLNPVQVVNVKGKTKRTIRGLGKDLIRKRPMSRWPKVSQLTSLKLSEELEDGCYKS